MKATLEFDLNDQDEAMEYARVTSATSAYLALHEIGNDIFRPHRKHGYNGKIQELIDQCPDIEVNGEKVSAGSEIVSLLEDMFHDIIEKNNINMNNLL